MLKKIVQRAKGRHSKKHGRQEKILEEKLEKGKPLTKTQQESKVFAKQIQNKTSSKK